MQPMREATMELDYQPDTVVIDPEDDMQIHGDDGYWHRLTWDLGRQACGPVVDDRLRQARRSSRSPEAQRYDGSLCPLCFTPFEIDYGQMVKKDAEAKALGSRPIPTLKEK
jgi:hypothetical protein